jgi:hypothetical protein
MHDELARLERSDQCLLGGDAHLVGVRVRVRVRVRARVRARVRDGVITLSQSLMRTSRMLAT